MTMYSMHVPPAPWQGVPVREHRGLPFEHDAAYLVDDTIFLPRWKFLLVTTNYNYTRALDLLAERMVQDVDRRLKEKNL